MGLPDELLAQARHLATWDEGIPSQANLRRSISSAYYALFHLLVADAVRLLSPAAPKPLAFRFARAFTHSEMKQACKSIAYGVPSPVFRELQPSGFSKSLLLVADTFVDLQDERHRADYDLAALYVRPFALRYIDLSEAAFEAWQEVREGDEANVFLTALLLHGRWSK